MCCRHVSLRLHELSPGQLAELLWCYAVLEERSPGLLLPLLQRLEGVHPKGLTAQQLLMLYQAHRLTTDGWLCEGSVQTGQEQEHKDAEREEEQQGQGQQLLGSSMSPPAAAASMAAAPARTDPVEAAWPPKLVHAAVQAAALAARRLRSGRMLLDVLDVLEDAGHEAVKQLPVDGGASVADVALLAGSLQVAIVCGGPGEYSRNAPHVRRGVAVAGDWVLERLGWRLVHVPFYEWQALADDELARVAYVHNVLAEQGMQL